jgi:hypothetical protein
LHFTSLAWGWHILDLTDHPFYVLRLREVFLLMAEQSKKRKTATASMALHHRRRAEGQLAGPQGSRQIEDLQQENAILREQLRSPDNSFLRWRQESLEFGTYDGQMNVNYEQHGFGETHYYNGHIYKGQWRDGRKQGFGTYTWPLRQSYVGHWNEGLEHGHGEFRFASGKCFDGDWVEGVPQTAAGSYKDKKGNSCSAPKDERILGSKMK